MYLKGVMENGRKKEKCVVKFQIYYCSIEKRNEEYYALCRINTKLIKTTIPLNNDYYNAMLHEINLNEIPNGLSITFYSMNHECIGNTYVKLLPQKASTQKYSIQTQTFIGESLIFSSLEIENNNKIQSIAFYRNGNLEWRKGIIPNIFLKPSKPNSIFPLFDGNQYQVLLNQSNNILQLTMNRPYFHLCYYLLHNQSVPSYTTLHTPSNLLELIGPTQLTAVVLGLLMNRRIILSSSSTTTVVFSVIQLLDFIKPLEYSYFCKAPCTLAEINTSSSYFVGIVSNEPIIKPGVISVDIDRGIVYGSIINVPSSIIVSLLPNLALLRKKNDKRYFIAFRWFMAQLLRNVDKFREYSWVADVPKPSFDKNSWLLCMQEDCFEFCLALAKTPMFCQFLYRKHFEFEEWMNIVDGHSFKEVYSLFETASRSLTVGKKSIDKSVEVIAGIIKTLNMEEVNCFITVPPAFEASKESEKNKIYGEITWVNRPNETTSKEITDTIKSQRGRIAVCYAIEQLANQTWLVEQARFEMLSKVIVELADVSSKEDDFTVLARILDLSDRIAVASGQKLITKLRKVPIKIDVWKRLVDIRLADSKKDIYQQSNRVVMNYESIPLETKNRMRMLEISSATNILNDVVMLMEYFGVKSKISDAFIEELSKTIPDDGLLPHKSL